MTVGSEKLAVSFEEDEDGLLQRKELEVFEQSVVKVNDRCSQFLNKTLADQQMQE